MKLLARWIFRVFARLVLRRYKPTVIGVAGSIGKTTAKEAIAAGLDEHAGGVRKTVGSFNAEIGVPVTIISGGRARDHWWEWLGIIWQAKKLLFLPKRSYPARLVLELGTDKPGDLAGLLKLAKPQIGVLTAITPEHLEYFGDMEAVTNEESLVLATLPKEGTAVVNGDEPNALAAAKKWKGRRITYGWGEGADVRATQEEQLVNDHGLPTGFRFVLRNGGERASVTVDGVIGRHQAYPFLAATAVALVLGQPVEKTAALLRRYHPTPGRMRLLEGLEGTLLIDDSYNASPSAMLAALEALYKLNIPGKRYAILGQMSELGSDAALWHDRIGERVSPNRIEMLITVGPLAERIGKAAIEKKRFPKKRIVNVPNAEAAATLLRPMLQPGDVTLLKGSRYASRLEKAVEILLAHPERDRERIVAS